MYVRAYVVKQNPTSKCMSSTAQGYINGQIGNSWEADVNSHFNLHQSIKLDISSFYNNTTWWQCLLEHFWMFWNKFKEVKKLEQFQNVPKCSELFNIIPLMYNCTHCQLSCVTLNFWRHWTRLNNVACFIASFIENEIVIHTSCF